MTTEKPKRGRPVTGLPVRKMTSFRMSQDIVDFLATVDDKTATTERAIRRTKEFREWIATARSAPKPK
jgi:uncharacterized protein (DUF4415 family)